MKVSLDGGSTWSEAREGVRIEIEVPTDEGEDEFMLLNFTHEGMVADLCNEQQCLATYCAETYDLKDYLFGD